MKVTVRAPALHKGLRMHYTYCILIYNFYYACSSVDVVDIASSFFIFPQFCSLVTLHLIVILLGCKGLYC